MFHAFSVNGELLSARLFVWSMENGQLLGAVSANQRPIQSIVSSSDRRTLVSCSADGDLQGWNVDLIQKSSQAPAGDGGGEVSSTA